MKDNPETVKFWGPDAAMFNKGCPCNKREKVLMAKRNCEDCGRIIYQGRLCTNCAKARKDGGEKMEQREVVKEVDAGVPSNPVMPLTVTGDGQVKDERTGKWTKVCRECRLLKIHHSHGLCAACHWILIGKPKKEVEREARRKVAKEWVAEKVNGLKKDEPKEIQPVPAPNIVLQFQDDLDADILNYIQAEAKRCRRTPDAQAMWMLQSHLPEMQGRATARAK